MNRLNEIEARANAATPGPWELLGDGEYVSGPGILVAPDDGGVTSADAEFIAAARTTVPALLDALEKVLELHESFEGSDSGGDLRCSGCYDSRYGVFEPYPCELVEAITTALEGETR